MRTDGERFRFLAKHQLSLTWSDDGVSIMWRGKAEPGKPGAYYPISRGKTLSIATDMAIEKWERKHRKRNE